MINKLNGFSIPSNMNPALEQIKERKITGEQPASIKVEGTQPTAKVEFEKPSETFPSQERKDSKIPTPQGYSAMQENLVEEDRVEEISKGKWGSVLDRKAGGNYSVDITTVSNN